MTISTVTQLLALDVGDIIDQILNGASLETPLLAKGQARIAPHHTGFTHGGLAGDDLAVLDHFADDSDRGLASQTAELDRGLGVAGALEDAAVAGSQGEDMAGTAEARGRGFGAGQRAARQGAVVGRDARRHGFVVRVNRHRVRRAVGVRVVDHHLWQPELRRDLGCHWGADQPAGVAHHEGHLLGRQILGRDDQIAFVLAVLVVEHDNELATPECLDSGLDRVELLGLGTAAGRDLHDCDFFFPFFV